MSSGDLHHQVRRRPAAPAMITLTVIVFGVMLVQTLSTSARLREELRRTAGVRVATREARDRFRAARLVIASNDAQERDPMLALLLAREACEAAMIPDAVSRLHDALVRNRELWHLPIGDNVVSARFLGSENRVLVRHEDGGGLIVDRSSGGIYRTPEGTCAFATGPDDTVFVGMVDGTAWLVSLQGRLERGGPTQAKVITELKGHTGPVRIVRILEDGWLLTVGDDNAARIWRVDGRCHAVLAGHSDSIGRIDASVTHRRVLTTSPDRTARLWDFEGNSLRTFRRGRLPVVAELSEAGEFVASGATSNPAWQLSVFRDRPDLTRDPDFAIPDTSSRQLPGIVHLWDLDGEPIVDLDHAKACGRTPAYRDEYQSGYIEISPDGEHLATCATHSVLWTRDGEAITSLRAVSLRFLGNDRVLMEQPDGCVAILDLKGNEVADIRIGGRAVHTDYSAADGLLLSCLQPFSDQDSFGPSAELRDRHGNLVARLSPAIGVVRGAAFLPSGAPATGSPDGIRSWSLDGRVVAHTPRTDDDHESDPIVDGFAAGRTLLADIRRDGRRAICVLGADTFERGSFRIGGDSVFPLGTAFSPDGKLVLSFAEPSSRLWRRDGTPVAVLRGVHNPVCADRAFAPNGTRVVTIGEGGVHLSTLDGKPVETRPMKNAESAYFGPRGDLYVVAGKNLTNMDSGVVYRHDDSFVVPCAFSADGQLIATSPYRDGAYVWRRDGTRLHHVQRDRKTAYRLEFDATAERLVMVFGSVDTWSDDEIITDPVVTLWAVEDRDLRLLWEGAGYNAAVHPGGERFVTADGNDLTVRDREGDRITTLAGHRGRINTVRFAPDGSRVLTASKDATARIWDLETGEAVVLRHPDALLHAVWAPTGDSIATMDEKGVVRIWIARPEELIEVAAQRATRDLSAAERHRYQSLLSSD